MPRITRPREPSGGWAKRKVKKKKVKEKKKPSKKK
jgi:hypothetical protein